MKMTQGNGLKTMIERPSLARAQALIAIILLQVNMALAVEPISSASSVQAPAQSAAEPLQKSPNTSVPFDMMLKTSHNPFDAYRGKTAPAPNMTNSARLDTLVRDGKLYLSLRDAIDLALENNLDMVIARFNLPIAQMDILRTSAGGQVRGVNTGVVSGTPGGGDRCRGDPSAHDRRAAARHVSALLGSRADDETGGGTDGGGGEVTLRAVDLTSVKTDCGTARSSSLPDQGRT